MDADAWSKEDGLRLRLISPVRLSDKGYEGFEGVLDILEATGKELRPDRMYLKRKLKYSRDVLRQRWHEVAWEEDPTNVAFGLSRSQPPETDYWLTCFPGNENSRSKFQLHLKPFALLKEPGQQEKWVERLVSLVRAMATHIPISYGFAHSATDLLLADDPHTTNARESKRVHGVYWLNVYGARMVEDLGRARVLATPAHLVEELPHGAVLVLTRPTPVDFSTPQARQAQARALVHLRPDLHEDILLASLRERSEAFVPVEKSFDEDIAEVLDLTVMKSVDLSNRGKAYLQWNQYHPPPVSEFLPASEVPPSDVEDGETAYLRSEEWYVRQLLALLLKDVPELRRGGPQSLPYIDAFVWKENWAHWLEPEDKEVMVGCLGAYVGVMLRILLQGRVVPRRKLDETAVVVGDKAWLPFLRARHLLERQQNAIDFSLTHFYRHARALSGR